MEDQNLIVAVCSRPVLYDTTMVSVQGQEQKRDGRWVDVAEDTGFPVRQGDPIRPQKPSGPAPLDDSQDLQTVGNQQHHSVRLRDPFRTQTRRCPATLELQEDLQTVGTQPHHSV
ncbi:unnamed protein product [Gadus morhua 'NCC']